MARIHIDLHYIHRDNIPKALDLLYEAGLIKYQQRDIRHCDLPSLKRSIADEGCFIEVKSYY